MTKVAFYTFGCKLNFAETSSISRKVSENGYDVVPFSGEADFYVFNTCTVTGEAGKKFIRMARQVKKRSPGAKVVAIGCFAELGSDALLQLDEVDMLLGNNQKYNLHEYLDKKTDIKISEHSAFREKDYFVDAFSLNDRTRSFLKIQDGCDYFCSYCTIPLARGASRSDSVEHILESVGTIIKNDVMEIVLTGVNIGDFRSAEGENLLDLLKKLDRFPGLSRLTLSSVEPELLTDEIIQYVSDSKAILPHFHIPLQSGSDKVLKLMHRKYNTALFAGRVHKIRELMPDAFIGIDVLVGFPGEDEADFNDTYSLLESLEISYLHVFPFSERANTKAALMPGKVDEKVKSERVSKLLHLSEKKNRRFYEKFTGQTRNVLFEKKIRNGFMFGLTDNYLKVKIPANASLINKIMPVFLSRLEDDGFFAGDINPHF